MQPIHHHIKTPDLTFSLYEWGDPDGPPLLLVHATGMNARMWDETIKYLPQDHRILALDMRGHGGSHWRGHLLDWSVPGEDVKQIIETLDLHNLVGVGHSMGGHSILQAAISMPERFKRLVLIDPVIFSPEFYASPSEHEGQNPTDHPIARRRNHFRDWQEMYTIFSGREPYSNWKEPVLENYCRYGLVDNDEDSKSLACHPETEASVYMGHKSFNPLPYVKDVTMPVKIIRAKTGQKSKDGRMDFSVSPTWPELVTVFPNGTERFLPELSHFIPMEDPELAAREIMEE